MKPTALLDDLLSTGFFAGHVWAQRTKEVLLERLAAWTGLPGLARHHLPPATLAPRTSPSRPPAGRSASSTWTTCDVRP
ncbi:MAG: hypothetical protein IPI43_29730 [Sandaracinaceae bacterium]|nr:hypothetical protein [Sandaracinaceae bacterium]